MAIKIKMVPHPEYFSKSESGIKRVVENYAKYLPGLGFELVSPKVDDFDLLVSHAGSCPNPDVVHVHGLYWTADYDSAKHEWPTNRDIINNCRSARCVTVPSNWVAEAFQRDMRLNPVVIPHGIDWIDWQEKSENGGYILWNKNRTGDVCDPTPVFQLARAYPNERFVTTFSTVETPMDNLLITGLLAHKDMKPLIQSAGLYLSTTKETFGIGVLEALASGVPVLGYAYGGNLDLVEHGVTGYLAEPGNFEDLKAGLEWCLKYRKSLSENAREAAKKWTWQAAVEKVGDVYRGVLYYETPSVAAIIPSYNYGTEEKLGRAVRSVLSQTFPARSIILVDDGSDDGGATRRLVEAYASADNRIRYVWQPNSGVSNARNNGVAITDSKYICCLDADDAIQPLFLERCVKALEEDPSLGIAYTGLYYIRPDGQEGASPWPGQFDFDKQLQKQNQVPTCCVFKRDMWERLGGYRRRYEGAGGAGAEDAEFWLRAGAYGFKAKKVTDETLFVYSWMSGRVSGNKEYREPDWLAWHPWVKDKKHPFASLATPKMASHAVRQYDEPTVSVIIPVGKGHEKEVLNALDSLDAQTFRKWEAIVVWDIPDDYNADDQQLYLQRAFPFIKWVFTRGKGAGYARNRGAEKARAPFLLFLDADDWLYPEAIQKMLEQWSMDQGIIYCDYVGKAIIDEKEVSKLEARLLHYNNKTHEAVLAHYASPFDCEKAVAQPDPRMYIWSLITSLTPRSWHFEIGGFDEKMASWEDWDYWIRMARHGHCFYRIAEPLVVYQFYSGTRRERGLHDAQNLIQYLLDKYKDEPMSPCGCSKKPSVNKEALLQSQAVQKGNDTQMPTDSNLVLALYNHPNKGHHKVVGMATRTNYGYRGGGDRFLVDKRDIAVNPDLFIVISTDTPAPKPTTNTPPPPPALQPEPQVAAPVEVKEAQKEVFDLQRVPGINSVNAAMLQSAGIFTLEDLVNFGEDKLVRLRGIGTQRAKIIINWAKEEISKGS